MSNGGSFSKDQVPVDGGKSFAADWENGQQASQDEKPVVKQSKGVTSPLAGDGFDWVPNDDLA